MKETEGLKKMISNLKFEETEVLESYEIKKWPQNL